MQANSYRDINDFPKNIVGYYFYIFAYISKTNKLIENDEVESELS